MGSFAAMSSTQILSNYKDVFILALISALLFLVSRSTFNGYGGKLGTLAFVAVLCVSFARAVL